MIEFSLQEYLSCICGCSYEEGISNQIKLFDLKQKKEREEFLEKMSSKLDNYYYELENYVFSWDMK